MKKNKFGVSHSLIAVVAMIFLTMNAWATPIKIKDISGREVTLKQPAQRIILADSRALQALQIVHPDTSFQSIIAWDNSLETKAPDLFSLYLKSYPQLAKLPVFNNPYMSDFSVENAVVMNPDLIIFDVGVASKLAESGVMAQLEKIGIPVVFIDFRLRPLTNTVASIRLLGEVLGGRKEQKNTSTFISPA